VPIPSRCGNPASSPELQIMKTPMTPLISSPPLLSLHSLPHNSVASSPTPLSALLLLPEHGVQKVPHRPSLHMRVEGTMQHPRSGKGEAEGLQPSHPCDGAPEAARQRRTCTRSPTPRSPRASSSPATKSPPCCATSNRTSTTSFSPTLP
jgi:hypothetical protein